MGKHSKPTRTKKYGKAVVRGSVAAGAGTAFLLSTGAANAATPKETLDAIASCESGNRPTVTGYSGKHYGLFQFDIPTWRSVGGTGNPSSASSSEQYKRAALLLERRGTQPWLDSQDCWDNKVSPLKAGQARSSEIASPTEKKQPAHSATKKNAKTYVVKQGDTLAEIAAAHGTTWRKLQQLNSGTVKNPNLIRVGWELKLP